MAEWLSFGLVPFFSGGVKLTQARAPLLPFAIAIAIALILQRECCRLLYCNAAGRTAYPEPELKTLPGTLPSEIAVFFLLTVLLRKFFGATSGYK